MDKSNLLSVDDDSTLVGGPKELGHLLSEAPHRRKSTILSDADMYKIMECPVCTKSMYPPIQQCPSGHALCSNCKMKVNNKCPVCKKEIGNIRCLVLEKFAVSLLLPCSNHTLGCQEMLPYYGKEKHESQCIFRPYSCPSPGSECSVMGDLPTLLAHLRVSHRVDIQTGSSFSHCYVKQDPCSVADVSWTLSLFNCFNQYFCLHFEAFCLGTEPVYMAFLRFIGEESEARKYGYCLEVGGNGRKLTWHGIPRSIRTHHRSVRDSHDGLIIQRSLALYFSKGDGKELKLRVSGKIWKEDS